MITRLMTVPELATWGVLLLVVVLFPLFSDDIFFIRLMGFAMAFALFALSIYVVLGWMGELSLGHAMFYGIGAYVAAGFMKNSGMPFLLATLVAMATMFAFAALIGFIVLRLTGAYFAIVTWGLSAVALVIVQSWTPVTGGALGMSGVPTGTIFGVSMADASVYAWVTGTALVLTILVLGYVRQTPFGRRVNGSRINRNLVRAAGANTYADRVVAYGISGAIAALAGALSLDYVRIPSPHMLAVTVSVDGLVMVLLGGVAFLLGPVVGAVFFRLIPEELQVPAEVRELVVAIAVLLIVLIAPRGIPEILGWIRDLAKRLLGGRKEGAPASSPKTEAVR